MLNFNESDFINNLGKLPQDLQDKLIMLKFDDNFLNIINYKNVKSESVVKAIDYATRITALGFASKQEMFNLIEDVIVDEDETRHIFEEIDKTILVPNNLQGAPEEIKADEEQEDVQPSDDYTKETLESAEDILREIENPTPSPLILPIIKPLPTVTTPEPPKEVVPQPNTENLIQTNKIPQQTPTKETQLDSKLTEPVVQPAKSTYYKVDPYREQIQ
jgi:hypothetical protein